ncbi:AAA family ATPase [Myxococcota bacterium]
MNAPPHAPVSLSAVEEVSAASVPEMALSDGDIIASKSGAGAGSSATPTSAALDTGQVLADRFQVLDVVGEGGMGIVYRCLDRATHEQVAVKRVILPEGDLAAEYVIWFYKEARALAALDHPCIVRARDYGQLADGSPYLVMDLAVGVSLYDLSHVPLRFELTWSIVDRLLSALAHAHARGIVHGDLKPSNVLVEEVPGQPPKLHILDFGLAWLKQDFHDERLDGAKAVEIVPHAGAGTPGFMAPEQVLHEMHHVCGATDLYALGCVLYRVFSGRPPFHGDAKDLLRWHAYDPVPELGLAVDAPREVVGFVMRLLAKQPWDRWEYAAEARAAWERLRPTVVNPKAYHFPDLPRQAALEAAPTRPTMPTDAERPSPQRGAECASGLLRMRPSPLVGREDIRRRLTDICREVTSQTGARHRLVLLVGPAGVGKSRTAEWLCEVVHEEARMVPLRARYRRIRGPLDGMLGAAAIHLNFERVDRETIERSLLARWRIAETDWHGRSWVAGAAEWLRPTAPGSDRPLGPSGVRFAVDTIETRRLVMRHVLSRIAGKRPLLFWLDDLHEAPPSTFDALTRLHEEEADRSIVWVATVRSEGAQRETESADRLRDLTALLDGEVVEIKPLDTEQTSRLLRVSLPLDDAAVAEATRRSRGNPLFALQQLHAWALAGALEFVDGVYRVQPRVLALRPETTAELWDSRVATVPEEYRLAAYAVATLGGDIRRSVLKPLLQSLGLGAEAAILSLQAAEIIFPRGPGRYTWPHALLQEHLLQRLSERPDARLVFSAAAEALTCHPSARTRRIVRQRVANLLNAGEPDQGAKLLFQHLSQAWNLARDPLAALSDLELLKGQVTGRSLAVRHRWHAEALRQIGRIEEAVSYAEMARAILEELAELEELAYCYKLLGHLGSERGGAAEGLGLVRRAYDLFCSFGNLLGQAQCEAVSGEIEYLLGNYEKARAWAERAEGHFGELRQPLGRGQCLMLLSWIEHSEGATERARRLTLEAKTQFERAGYRLGMAQANASVAHIEYRLFNFHSAERGAEEALLAFDTLRSPRGQAACERLLGLVALDTDEIACAEQHAKRALALYAELGDPWGVVESRLLECQTWLARSDLLRAQALLDGLSAVSVEEAEPKQHLLLTHAWFWHQSGDRDQGLEALESASEVFSQRCRAGDHTPHLLSRLSRLAWPGHAMDRIVAWRAILNNRARRSQESRYGSTPSARLQSARLQSDRWLPAASRPEQPWSEQGQPARTASSRSHPDNPKPCRARESQALPDRVPDNGRQGRPPSDRARQDAQQRPLSPGRAHQDLAGNGSQRSAGSDPVLDGTQDNGARGRPPSDRPQQDAQQRPLSPGRAHQDLAGNGSQRSAGSDPVLDGTQDNGARGRPPSDRPQQDAQQRPLSPGRAHQDLAGNGSQRSSGPDPVLDGTQDNGARGRLPSNRPQQGALREARPPVLVHDDLPKNERLARPPSDRPPPEALHGEVSPDRVQHNGMQSRLSRDRVRQNELHGGQSANAACNRVSPNRTRPSRLSEEPQRRQLRLDDSPGRVLPARVGVVGAVPQSPPDAVDSRQRLTQSFAHGAPRGRLDSKPPPSR